MTVSPSPEMVVEEFEKRLLGSPNSSMLWIKYMSMMLKLVDLAKARAVAERALQTINFREEQEKMNVWVAYLNLENLYGSADTLKKVFDRSLIYCEPKTMYMQLVKIYQHNEKPEEAMTLLKVMIKKFSQSCKVWLTLAEILYARDIGAGRKLLQQSLKSLAKRKHEKITMKFAQLEYNHGSQERGRTLFETTLTNSPRKLDFWSIYITMEENRCKKDDGNNKEFVRRLFERVVSLKLSSKKAKYFYKRFLNFEKQYGNESSITHVKDLARQYVENSSFGSK